MSRRFDVITFDCYGTLVDWEAGISGAFLSTAAVSGTVLDPEAILRAYSRLEMEVEAEPFRPYREVLKETARRVASELGFTIPSGGESFLPESLPAWPPFPDTNEALLKLSVAGYRLGILSNVDENLLTATCRRFSVPFDFVITAQQVSSYKPEHAHFLAAKERLGTVRWLHAAQSFFHDVIPASELGIPVAWINRKRETSLAGDVAPTVELPHLAALTEWLQG
jgi:2-haloalkanoic acid dehalogenase type II